MPQKVNVTVIKITMKTSKTEKRKNETKQKKRNQKLTTQRHRVCIYIWSPKHYAF